MMAHVVEGLSGYCEDKTCPICYNEDKPMTHSRRTIKSPPKPRPEPRDSRQQAAGLILASIERRPETRELRRLAAKRDAAGVALAFVVNALRFACLHFEGATWVSEKKIADLTITSREVGIMGSNDGMKTWHPVDSGG